MSTEAEKLKSSLAQLAGLFRNEQTQQVDAPFPPGMRLVWESDNTPGQTSVARLTTDGATVIAYEVATTRASLGEWQWKRVALPFSAEAAAVIAEKLIAVCEPIAVISARLLLLQATVIKLLDDPQTPEPVRTKITSTLREIGVITDEPVAKS